MGQTTITKIAAAIQRCPMLVALSTVLVTPIALAQPPDEALGTRNVTVVTLYSESRNPGTEGEKGTRQRPPIQIVNGGVKSAGPSCWELSPSGNLVTVAGDCYILRSADPGEEPPAR